MLVQVTELGKFLFDCFLYLLDINIFNEALLGYCKVKGEGYFALKNIQLPFPVSQHDL